MRYFDKSSLMNDFKWSERPETDYRSNRSHSKKAKRDMKEGLMALQNRIKFKCGRFSSIWWESLNEDDRLKAYIDYQHLIKAGHNDEVFKQNILILRTLIRGDIAINRDLTINELLNEI